MGSQIGHIRPNFYPYFQMSHVLTKNNVKSRKIE